MDVGRGWTWETTSAAAATAGLYARLERQMRSLIDRVGRRVCPGCGRLCCRGPYCRATATNPWYGFVHRLAGGPALPPDAAARRDPFGLGPGGCELRAGRYLFCYSYNCPLILAFVTRRGVAEAFQELSDLLRPINRLPGGRLLHELGPGDTLTPEDLAHLHAATTRAARRLAALRPLLEQALDATAPDPGRQAGEGGGARPVGTGGRKARGWPSAGSGPGAGSA